MSAARGVYLDLSSIEIGFGWPRKASAMTSFPARLLVNNWTHCLADSSRHHLIDPSNQQACTNWPLSAVRSEMCLVNVKKHWTRHLWRNADQNSYASVNSYIPRSACRTIKISNPHAIMHVSLRQSQTSLASVIVIFSLMPKGQSMWRTSLLRVSMNTISTNSALNIAK